MKNLADFGLNAEVKTKLEICVTHGDFESRNVFGKVWTGCPICAAHAQAERDREEEEKASVERHRVWQRKLRNAGIPERFRDRTLESYRVTCDGQRLALNFAKAYADGFDDVLKAGRGAIFCGSPGTGKNHLAIGIGLQVMAQNKIVQYTTVQRMMRSIKDAWRKDSVLSESDVIDALVEPDLLIIDEIGVQYGSKFEQDQIFDILNERYEKRRPVLLLSNLTKDEVKAFLGERIYDRLREDGGQAISFKWESYRGVRHGN